MIPKRVTLENFLSYGSRTEIDFADEALWVINGPNGCGKSTIFDAMTYCLFAEHRDGKRGVDRLVRSGQNGFSVSFEFEIAGIEYRVSRSRSGNRGTQQLEHKPNGSWTRVLNVDGVEALNEWVRQTLGLTFEAFTASVLLRQGEADKILDATPAERLGLLKKIIGVERYEQLSDRVSTARKRHDTARQLLVQRRDALPDIRTEELQTAEDALRNTATTLEEADRIRGDCEAAIHQSRQWEVLSQTRTDLKTRLDAAAERDRHAEAIRRGFARSTELNAVLPDLRLLLPLRDRLSGAVQRQQAVTEQRDTLRAARQITRDRIEAARLLEATHRQSAADLSAEIARQSAEYERETKFLHLAQELETLRASAAQFSPALDAELAHTQSQLQAAYAEERAARDRAQETNALRKQAQNQRAQFDQIAVDVPCSQCGQPVTAEHANRERQRLSETIIALDREWLQHQEAERAATKDRIAADTAVQQLQQQLSERDRTTARLCDGEASLLKLGGRTGVTEIRTHLDQLAAALTDIRQRHATARDHQQNAETERRQLEPQLQQLDADCQRADNEVSRLQKDLAQDSARYEAVLERLPEVWRATADADLTEFEAELRQLRAAKIDEQYRDWTHDTTLRDEWQRQLDVAECQLAEIPEAGRVPMAQAEAHRQTADQAFRVADAAHRQAVSHHETLSRRRRELDQLREQIALAEAEARVHEKLDVLLGKQKLQRELLREGELAIVRYAQQSLTQLSCGDLSVALMDADDGDDKALDLQVRLRDDPNPIGVKMLSGSQKFRVAIALALAIGRFASGRARPLECVIIDEGFGSLDQDGLRAAAEELNNLKGHLKRIILVSHQEEFTDRFPAVIRLSRTESGTVAHVVRNSG